MQRFSELFRELDETTSTARKLQAILRYLEAAPPADTIWGIWLLSGRKLKRTVSTTLLKRWCQQHSGTPDWLFEECYATVGDLAETLALLLPDSVTATADPRPLHQWFADVLIPLQAAEETAQQQLIMSAWQQLDPPSRFLFNKFVTGGFRVGVSQQLVCRALAEFSGVPLTEIVRRMMGDWSPTPEFYALLLAPPGSAQPLSQPYPFCLAQPLMAPVESLGAIEDWIAEWKWDGIRAQLIRRHGETYLWSRGEELLNDRFPEVLEAAKLLPRDCVLDGELLAWGEQGPLPFQQLQRRIQRTKLTAAVLREVPVRLLVFDLLEEAGEDLRELPFAQRLPRLQELFAGLSSLPATRAPEPAEKRKLSSRQRRAQKTLTLFDDESPGEQAAPVPIASRSTIMELAPTLTARSWEELSAWRAESRSRGVEGLMLKHIHSRYVAGRETGLWWKWKIEPLTCDAVLIGALKGHGRRADLYTDYTFAVWAEGELVPIARAYSGLSDAELQEFDRWIRHSIVQKFGNGCLVKPELVFELAFEQVQESTRHKSGLALRFPRIVRPRPDKLPAQADQLASLRQLLPGRAQSSVSSPPT